MSLFADHLNQDEDNEETAYEDDDSDDDDQEETNDPFNYFNKIKSNQKNPNSNKKQIWNNQFKKKKIPNSNLPHPNVAIRVAKVAYYNSKIGHSQAATSSSVPTNQSNTNAFKSAIFTNGIRGNFFSQERLPLRSCKIKMKLTPSREYKIKFKNATRLEKPLKRI